MVFYIYDRLEHNAFTANGRTIDRKDLVRVLRAYCGYCKPVYVRQLLLPISEMITLSLPLSVEHVCSPDTRATDHSTQVAHTISLKGNWTLENIWNMIFLDNLESVCWSWLQAHTAVPLMLDVNTSFSQNDMPEVIPLTGRPLHSKLKIGGNTSAQKSTFPTIIWFDILIDIVKS